MTGKNRPIGIIGAMDVEVQLLKEALAKGGAVSPERFAGMEFFCGEIAGVPVVVTQCDVGMVNAAVHAQVLIDRFTPRCVLNTGVGGSLDASIDIGDLVLATEAVNHVMDVCNLGYEPGQTPGLDVLAFPCDDDLRKTAAVAATEMGLRVHEGRIASGDRFVRDEEDKQRIIDLFKARCCEMEGAAIAQTCWLNGVPCGIMRAISDKADGTDHIDYPVFEEQAARTCAQLLVKLLPLL